MSNCNPVQLSVTIHEHAMQHISEGMMSDTYGRASRRRGLKTHQLHETISACIHVELISTVGLHVAVLYVLFATEKVHANCSDSCNCL